MGENPQQNPKREKAPDPLLEAMHSFDQGLKGKPQPKEETARVQLPPRPEAKKTGNITTPEGKEYWEDGELLQKVLKDKTEELYSDGKLQKRSLPNGDIEYYADERMIGKYVHETGITENYNEKAEVIKRIDINGKEILIPQEDSRKKTVKLPLLPSLDAPGVKKPESEPVFPESGKIFKYTALDSRGNETRGTVSASDTNNAIGRLKDMGLFPTQIEEVRDEEQTENESKKEKRPGFFRRNALKIALATGILVAPPVGYVGTKKALDHMGQGDEHYPALKLKMDKKETPKKEGGIYTSPATNLSAELERVKAEENTKIEKIKADMEAKFDAELAKRDLSFSNKLVAVETAMKSTPATSPKAQSEEKWQGIGAIGSAPIVQPEPAKKITKEELLAGIEQKILKATKEGKNPNLASDEANMWNTHLINQPTVAHTGETMQIGQKEQTPQPTRTPYEPPMGEKVTGVGDGGVNIAFNSNPNGINFNNPAQTQATETQAKNPFNLTPKMLEKVEEIYESNIDKIFPNDTLQNWRNIKDKSADEFMGRPEGKIKKVQKPLYDYLKQLEEKTKLKPKSGILRDRPESVEQYMERALQEAAKGGEKKLKELELK